MRYGHRLRVRVTGSGRAVTVDAVDGDGPTVEIKLARTADTKADEAQVTVYGLRPGYLSELVRDGATCQISAGLGSLSGLCTGRIVPGSYVDGVSGQDRVTSWTMLDGRAELRDVTVSRSWTSTDSAAVWDYLVAQSGLPLGSLRPGRVVQYPRGYVMAGGWRREAERIAAATGSRFVIQSGTLQVWPDGGHSRIAVSYSDPIRSWAIPPPWTVDASAWPRSTQAAPSTRATRGGLRAESTPGSGPRRPRSGRYHPAGRPRGI